MSPTARRHQKHLRAEKSRRRRTALLRNARKLARLVNEDESRAEALLRDPTRNLGRRARKRTRYWAAIARAIRDGEPVRKRKRVELLPS